MPLIAGGLVPLFVMLAAMVLIGLSQTHASTQGGSGVKGFLEGLVTKPLAAIINLASQATRALTSRFAAAQLALVAAWFGAMATLWRFVFQSSAEYAHAAAHAIEAVWDALPREIRREVAPVRRLARRAEHTATHALRRAESVAHSLDRLRARVNARLHAVEHTITVTLPHEIGRIRARERELERVYEDLRGRTKALERGAIRTFEWLRTHPRSAAMAAFAGVVAIALTRLGLGMFRCNSLKRLLKKRGCGLWGDLDELLGLAVLTVGALEFETLVREAQGLTEEAIGSFEDVFGIHG
jgi:hypothetical protein